MDIVLIILGAICLLVGIIGCIVPGLPGVPLAYLGLLCAHWTERAQLSWQELVIWAAITIFVTVLDYIVPAWGTKQLGGTKWGVWGSIIGLLVGLFFGIKGIIIGPFVGAVLGELLYFKRHPQVLDQYTTKKGKYKKAFVAGLGSFLGLMVGTVIKLICCGVMIFYFIKELI